MGAEDGPDPDVGYTGARFGGAPRRRKTRKRKAAEQAAAIEAPTDVFAAVRAAFAQLDQARADPSDAGDQSDPDGPVVGLTGARFAGAPVRPWDPGSQDGHSAEEIASPKRPTLPLLSGMELGEFPVEPSGSLSVRPYVYTRGRTRPQFELSLESLVSLVPSAPVSQMSDEHQAVIELCRESRSVAEIAALLGLPLGVARVLLGDLAAAGVLAVHRTAGAAGPDITLMERVLAGLRRL